MSSCVPRAWCRFLNFILTSLSEAGVLFSLFVRQESCGSRKRLARSFSLQQVGNTGFQLTRSAFKPLFVAMSLASYIISSHGRGHSRPNPALGDSGHCRAVTQDYFTYLRVVFHVIPKPAPRCRWRWSSPFHGWGQRTFRWSSVSQMLAGLTSHSGQSGPGSYSLNL